MNWPRLIVVISLVGIGVALFGATISSFLVEIDWSMIDDPLTILGTIIGGITATFDSTLLLYPYTFSFITITIALSVAKFAFVRFFTK
jgi:hypothetical protein